MRSKSYQRKSKFGSLQTWRREKTGDLHDGMETKLSDALDGAYEPGQR